MIELYLRFSAQNPYFVIGHFSFFPMSMYDSNFKLFNQEETSGIAEEDRSRVGLCCRRGRGGGATVFSSIYKYEW